MTNHFYNEILIEHNIRPDFKYKISNPTVCLHGVNPSCGDNITLHIQMDGDRITEISFDGVGCAISQASADIMAGLITGKTKEEARHFADIFDKMIKDELSDSELEELQEAAALKEISHMPARVKCAVLGWRTLREALSQ